MFGAFFENKEGGRGAAQAAGPPAGEQQPGAAEESADAGAAAEELSDSEPQPTPAPEPTAPWEPGGGAEPACRREGCIFLVHSLDKFDGYCCGGCAAGNGHGGWCESRLVPERVVARLATQDETVSTTLVACAREGCIFAAHRTAQDLEGYCCGTCQNQGKGHGRFCEMLLERDRAASELARIPTRVAKVAKLPPKKEGTGLAPCANPRCGYLAHTGADFGGFCCKGCKDGGHGDNCQRVDAAGKGAQVACANPDCSYRASLNAAFGGYCCRACPQGKPHGLACTRLPTVKVGAWASGWAGQVAGLARRLACARPGCGFLAHPSVKLHMGHCCLDCWLGEGHGESCSKEAAPPGICRSIGTARFGPGPASPRELACASPGCPHLAHRNTMEYGGYCCKICFFYAKGDRHDATCELRRAPTDAIRANATWLPMWRDDLLERTWTQHLFSVGCTPADWAAAEGDEEGVEAQDPVDKEPTQHQDEDPMEGLPAGLRVLVLVQDTRGDAQPALMLAMRLQSVGYVVQLLASESIRGLLTSLNESFQEEVDIAFHTDWRGTHLSRKTRDVFSRATSFRPDILLYQYGSATEAWAVEEDLGTVVCEYTFCPRPYSNVAARMHDIAASKRSLNAHIGSPLPDWKVEDVADRMGRQRPILYALSTDIAERHPFWPRPTATSGVHATGPWFPTVEQEMQLLATRNVYFGGDRVSELEDFLARGPPPVFVNLGGAASKSGYIEDDDCKEALAVRALKMAGKRGIVQGCADKVNQRLGYRRLRFRPLKIRWKDKNTILQVGGIELRCEGGRIISQLPGDFLSCVGGQSPEGCEPQNAMDGNTATEWHCAKMAPLIIRLPEPTVVDAWRFYTNSTNPSADPVRWVLEGSTSATDDGSWRVLQEQIDLDYTGFEAQEPFDPSKHEHYWLRSMPTVWFAIIDQEEALPTLGVTSVSDESCQAYADENVLFMPATPHQWLFPRCCTALHHGGSGSTAASLRAGRPTIVCPDLDDTMYWAEQVERLEVGVKIRPRWDLDRRMANVHEVAQAILQCDKPDIVERAAELGRKLREEDGIGKAVSVISRFAKECAKSRPLPSCA